MKNHKKLFITHFINIPFTFIIFWLIFEFFREKNYYSIVPFIAFYYIFISILGYITLKMKKSKKD